MLEERKIDETKETLSRRDFLVKAGALTAGMAVVGGALGTIAADEAKAAVSYPLPFTTKLDVAYVRKVAYDAYFCKGGCCIGAAYGLYKGFVKSEGEGTDWDNYQPEILVYGAGWINSWGTLCGALNGSLYLLNSAVEWGLTPNIASTLSDELIGWYTKYPFPSTQMDTYIDEVWNGTYSAGQALPISGITIPASVTSTNHIAYKGQTTLAVNSPLCHVSVSSWCKKANTTVNGTPKKVRCAKLTADVAAAAATLLNKYLAVGNNVRTSFATAKATTFCMNCHTGTGANPNITGYNKKDDEQGKMPCLECHGDEHVAALHNAPSTVGAAFDKDCGVCHK